MVSDLVILAQKWLKITSSSIIILCIVGELPGGRSASVAVGFSATVLPQTESFICYLVVGQIKLANSQTSSK